MANVARDVIWPKGNDVVVLAVFLHVGQGDCTIVLVKDGAGYKTVVQPHHQMHSTPRCWLAGR